MYAQHFGLRQEPFSIAPDPRFLYMSGRHREALAHLLYGVAADRGPVAGQGPSAGWGGSGGFVLLTGDIGTGKTTICRCFLAQVPAGCRVAYIFNPRLSVLELLQTMVEEFHIDLPPQAAATPTLKNHIDALNTFLLARHAAGEGCVLVIDEAQNLPADVLEQLRLLTNLETNERKLLQIVLIGQPELRTLLDQPHMEQLAQRVVARFHLDALTPTETAHYVAHRLAVAGHSGPLPFDAAALRRIHRLTQGVPRRINLLCGRALLGAWAQGLGTVSVRVVDQAAAEVWGHAPAAPARAWSWATAWPERRLRTAAWVLLGASALGAAAWWAGPLTGALRGGDVASAPFPLTTASTAPTAGQPLADAQPEDLLTLLPQLPLSANVAWGELAQHWGLPPSAHAQPCDAQAGHDLWCYSSAQFTGAWLRQLNRPGVLTLHAPDAPPAYATLVGLDAQHARLRLNGRTHTVRWAQLAALWRGEWATFWRPPPGYTQRLADGVGGPPIDWLVQQLNALDGQTAPAASAPPARLDAALRERVRTFQRAHGLPPDGRPGAMTFMQLDLATGVQVPHLHTTPH